MNILVFIFIIIKNNASINRFTLYAGIALMRILMTQRFRRVYSASVLKKEGAVIYNAI